MYVRTYYQQKKVAGYVKDFLIRALHISCMSFLHFNPITAPPVLQLHV